MGNGLYFMNCSNDQGARRSGIAFYTDLGANNLNVNEQPAAFVYTDTSGWTVWESQPGQKQGKSKQKLSFRSFQTRKKGLR